VLVARTTFARQWRELNPAAASPLPFVPSSFVVFRLSVHAQFFFAPFVGVSAAAAGLFAHRLPSSPSLSCFVRFFCAVVASFAFRTSRWLYSFVSACHVIALLQLDRCCSPRFAATRAAGEETFKIEAN
jgi:hypothetical protein